MRLHRLLHYNLPFYAIALISILDSVPLTVYAYSESSPTPHPNTLQSAPPVTSIPMTTPTVSPTWTPVPTTMSAHFRSPGIYPDDYLHPAYQVRTLAEGFTFHDHLAINSDTSEIFLVREVPLERIEIYKTTLPLEGSTFSEIFGAPVQVLGDDVLRISQTNAPYWLEEIAVGAENELVLIRPGNAPVYILNQQGQLNTVDVAPLPGAFLAPVSVIVIAEDEYGFIPGTEAGDTLVLSSFLHASQYISNHLVQLNSGSSDTPVASLYAPFGGLPSDLFVQDLTQVRAGALYLLIRLSLGEQKGPCKIFWLHPTLGLQEVSHELIFIDGRELIHDPVEQSFFITSEQTGEQGTLYRISSDTNENQYMGRFRWTQNRTLIPDPNGNGFYFTEVLEDGQVVLRRLERKPLMPDDTPTPTPVFCASPTPKPILGWFVLDGLGGIHSTNREIEIPVLPYWGGFNIARDLEPDPLGQGWYLLDGFGTIHASTPALPVPKDLPWFGFDIARNLEVKLDENRNRQFYLLDGFGVIHSTDPEFEHGNHVWFTQDMARDLEPRVEVQNCIITEEGWTILDAFGNMYMQNRFRVDTIRLTHPGAIAPIMRGFVRYPNETTAMIDLFGGRHTNPYYPAANVIGGLPENFYFPGWDIIWDVELIRAP
jgi:hypothetical protein